MHAPTHGTNPTLPQHPRFYQNNPHYEQCLLVPSNRARRTQSGGAPLWGSISSSQQRGLNYPLRLRMARHCRPQLRQGRDYKNNALPPWIIKTQHRPAQQHTRTAGIYSIHSNTR